MNRLPRELPPFLAEDQRLALPQCSLCGGVRTDQPGNDLTLRWRLEFIFRRRSRTPGDNRCTWIHKISCCGSQTGGRWPTSVNLCADVHGSSPKLASRQRVGDSRIGEFNRRRARLGRRRVLRSVPETASRRRSRFPADGTERCSSDLRRVLRKSRC